MSIRQVVLIPHTHHDVGYTNSPRVVDGLHREIVGEALRLADAFAAPGPDQFRWTFEVARPVLGYLRSATADEVAALQRLVGAGRVSVTGGYLNMTQLPSAAEFDAAYELLGELRAAGLDVRTEQHGDVKGTEGLVLITDALRPTGLGDVEFSIGGHPARVENGIVRLQDGRTAGSVLTMDRALRNLAAAGGHSPESLWRTASRNAAIAAGVDDRKGLLAPGFDADLVVVDAEVNVQATIVAGRVVHDRRADHVAPGTS